MIFIVSAGDYFYILVRTSLTQRVLPMPGTPEMSVLMFTYIDFQSNPDYLNFILSNRK